MRPPLLALSLVMIPAVALAAGISPSGFADLKRGYAAGSLSTSEAPAVRAERALREPSAGFLLGVALGAWSAARDQLAFDLEHPSAAGAPHASQGEADRDAIDQACGEEKVAFGRLEGRSREAGADEAAVVAAAGADSALPKAWKQRRDHAPNC